VGPAKSENAQVDSPAPAKRKQNGKRNDLDSKENSRDALHIEVRVTEVYATFREKLITILNGDVCSVSITLHNGRTIDIGSDPKRNPHELAVEVWVGGDYIELNNDPGRIVPAHEIVPFSEIVSVTHF
jgi:hypothetical protein